MSRNIEIKAKIENFEKTIRKVADFTKKEPTLLKQHDIFYNSKDGRLKMRSVEENGVLKTELIWYDRADVAGPKLSSYSKIDVPLESLNCLKMILEKSMKTKGEVKKIRYLFIHESTRIHIDRVEDLGDFIELEVGLSSNDSVVDGEKFAENLCKQLEINRNDLLTGAYLDMLN